MAFYTYAAVLFSLSCNILILTKNLFILTEFYRVNTSGAIKLAQITVVVETDTVLMRNKKKQHHNAKAWLDFFADFSNMKTKVVCLFANEKC